MTTAGLPKLLLEINEQELELLLWLVKNKYHPQHLPNVLTKHQLMNKLESLKTAVPTNEEPTELILAFTNLTEALGRATEAIQKLGVQQALKNKIESLPPHTLDGVPNPGQFVRVCHWHMEFFDNPEDYTTHFLTVNHE
jgi:hypothetical protein